MEGGPHEGKSLGRIKRWGIQLPTEKAERKEREGERDRDSRGGDGRESGRQKGSSYLDNGTSDSVVSLDSSSGDCICEDQNSLLPHSRYMVNFSSSSGQAAATNTVV